MFTDSKTTTNQTVNSTESYLQKERRNKTNTMKMVFKEKKTNKERGNEQSHMFTENREVLHKHVTL